jgi:two-component system cell cycle response regulator
LKGTTDDRMEERIEAPPPPEGLDADGSLAPVWASVPGRQAADAVRQDQRGVRLLVADDHVEFGRFLVEILMAAGHDVVVAHDGRQARDALLQGGYDIAVLDWVMPEIDGVSLCRMVREHSKARYLYIILLTVRNDPEDIVAGLNAGADDYVTKPFRSAELLARVRAGERIVRLQRELREANEQLAVLALTDELTGLPNRRAILQRLEDELTRSQRERRPLSVALVDVDELKAINDTFGHGAGDSVLKGFSRLMAAHTRSYDYIGRFGGDEFLLVLPGVDEEQALAVGHRLCTLVCEMPARSGRGGEQSISASVGIAEAHPDDGPTDLLARADEALYRSKSRGGHQVSTDTQ